MYADHLESNTDSQKAERARALQIRMSMNITHFKYEQICKDADTWAQVVAELEDIREGNIEKQAMKTSPQSIDPINY